MTTCRRCGLELLFGTTCTDWRLTDDSPFDQHSLCMQPMYVQALEECFKRMISRDMEALLSTDWTGGQTALLCLSHAILTLPKTLSTKKAKP